MNCPVCGSVIFQEGKGAHYAIIGRPKSYCSKNCSNFMKYFNAMQKELDSIQLDDVHKRKIRGELFRVANTLKLVPSRSFSTKKPRA